MTEAMNHLYVRRMTSWESDDERFPTRRRSLERRSWRKYVQPVSGYLLHVISIRISSLTIFGENRKGAAGRL